MRKESDRMSGRMTFEQRFWEKVQKTPSCWIWLASRRCGGYGEIWDKTIGRTRCAHRVSYEWSYGPIPKGLTVHHKCNNPPCVNPEHLEVMTMRENTLLNDSAVSRNARKTHCPQGHPYDGVNTFHYKKQHRQCRTCKRQRDNERSLKNKSKQTWRNAAGKSL